jgi:hypothetical protein
MPALNKDQWRLGHRRPWWQWNVLTLFAALFVLVWVRELVSLHYVVTWLLCAAVLAVWLILPFLWQGVRDDLLPRRSESRGAQPSTTQERTFGTLAYLLCALAWLMLLGMVFFA